MTIKLLTFDLDDTLWDLGPVLPRADQRAFEWLCAQVPALAERFTVESFREARLQLAAERPDIGHRVSALRRHAQRELLQGVGISASAAEQLSGQAFDIFLQARHEIEFFESALDVLTELRQRYLLVAVTNGNASPARLGLDHLFAYTVNSEDLTRPKPHPEPFEAALHYARCTATQAIHIGDHIDHDIRGAKMAGMRTIWINRAGEEWPGDDLPDADIQHLAQLPDAVDRIDCRKGS